MKLFPPEQSTRAEDKEYVENLIAGKNKTAMMHQARSDPIEARVQRFKDM